MNPIGACEFTRRKVGLGTGEEAIGKLMRIKNA
jgi:hypothetical protein